MAIIYCGVIEEKLLMCSAGIISIHMRIKRPTVPEPILLVVILYIYVSKVYLFQDSAVSWRGPGSRVFRHLHECLCVISGLVEVVRLSICWWGAIGWTRLRLRPLGGVIFR